MAIYLLAVAVAAAVAVAEEAVAVAGWVEVEECHARRPAGLHRSEALGRVAERVHQPLRAHQPERARQPAHVPERAP